MLSIVSTVTRFLQLQVNINLPSLFKYVHSSYGASSFLAFGDHLLLSEEGVQQGDPLGPLLFCLAILPIVKRLSSPLNLWYLDDGTLGGSPFQVLADFELIQSEGIHISLQVNAGKCEVVDLNGCCDLSCFENVQQVDVTNLILLGAPLGRQAMSSVLGKKISELSSVEDRLSWISSHHAFFLLKNCFTLPKLLYILRTSPCFAHPLLQSFHDLQIYLLRSLLNIRLDDRASQQVSLPVRFGGIGIIKATSIASSAYISSKLSCVELETSLLPDNLPLPPSPSDLDHAFTNWKACSNTDALPSSTRKRDWSLAVFQNTQQSLLSSTVDAQDEARLLASAQKESGAWLEALPVPSLGLHLSNNELRVVVSLRLGVPTCAEHTCACNEKVGILGTHGLKCKKSKGRFSCHHAVNDIIARALNLANLPAMLEPSGIVREDNKQLDGMTNVPWSLVWDFTCPYTLAPSHLRSTAAEAGSAAKEAEERKVSKYRSIAAYHTFIPVSVETLGPMGPEAKSVLLELGRFTAYEPPEGKERPTPHYSVQRHLNLNGRDTSLIWTYSQVGRKCCFHNQRATPCVRVVPPAYSAGDDCKRVSQFTTETRK